ncbi:uncharacterized protein LOC117116584 [Anneissia japonica]|uniref:uncharacterized protein LOC117116584 n=1 Tax=Anneissia japonica TaxID=1529436 RepID=UPI00142580C8|nr:uncharacterized protein LOC117116584 [Anneissia japonica]
MKLVLSVYLIAAVFRCTWSAICDPISNPNWMPIEDEKYDRNYTNGRPLGFQSSVIRYFETDAGGPSPCFTVPNAHDKRIEIMAESSPAGSVICVEDQLGREFCDTKLYDCRQAADDTVFFRFFCDAQGCSDSDVTFWFRFTVSLPPNELDPELWCNERNTDEYPSSLFIPLPTGRDLIPITPSSTASPMHDSLSFMFLFMFGVIIIPLNR